MRSNSRELNLNEIINMLNKVQHCRLAVCENNQPYVVPMSFRYKCEGNGFKFLFNSLNEGVKIKFLSRNSKVCIEFDRNVGNAIDSIIVIGSGRIFNDPCGDRSVILEVISSKVTGKRTFLEI